MVYALDDVMRLDACCKNPIQSKGRSIGTVHGLIAVEPFKWQIIAKIQPPNLRMEDVMREVQDAVETLALTHLHRIQKCSWIMMAPFNQFRECAVMQIKEESITRRFFMLVGATCFVQPARASELADALRQGGVLLLRHAATESGIGDPDGFRLGQCATQRNLSEQGRMQAQSIGAWFRNQGLQPTAVRSSQWCRCQDTARLAFGRYQDWPALNSTFAGQGNHAEQMRILRKALRQLPAQALEVWVTHQVIMTGLTGAYPAMGEGLAVNAQGEVRARGMMGN